MSAPGPRHGSSVALHRRHALAGLLAMAGAACMAEVARPTTKMADLQPAVDLERLFPSRFEGWQVDLSLPVVLPAPDVQARLDAIYNQVLARTYIDAQGHRVMLSVAYGGDQSDGTSAHRPEVCYPAQGFQILSNQRSSLRVGDRVVSARLLSARLGGRREPLVYWIVIGGMTTTSGFEQKLAQLRFGVRGLIPDGMLVRVSSIDADTARARRVHQQFLAALSQALGEPARDRIFGLAKATAPPASGAMGSGIAGAQT
jgi:EpsI family protein